MTKSVVGVYETPEETMNAIEGLNYKGYDKDNISVITSRRDTDYLEEHTGADVENANGSHNEQNESLWEKIKDYFTMNDSYGHGNPLNSLDIRQDELNSYTTELNEGKFIVAVEDAAAPVSPEDSPVGDPELRTEDNLPDSNYPVSNRALKDTTLGDTISLGSAENTAAPLGTSAETDSSAGRRTTIKLDTRNTGNDNYDTGTSAGEPGTISEDADFRTTRGGIDKEDHPRVGNASFGAGKLDDEVTGVESNEQPEELNKKRFIRANDTRQ